MGGTMSSITINGDTSGSIILQAPSVAGSTTLTLPTTSGTVLTSANAFSAGTGPAFSAYNSNAAQSLSLATWTKITLNAEEFDTASCFDSTTNYRFTPNVAGYYQVNACLFFDYSVSQFTDAAAAIYKNGSAVKRINQYGYGGYGMGNVSALIYMNGTTDYLEIYGYISGGSGPQIYSNFSALNTYVSAYLARAA